MYLVNKLVRQLDGEIHIDSPWQPAIASNGTNGTSFRVCADVSKQPLPNEQDSVAAGSRTDSLPTRFVSALATDDSGANGSTNTGDRPNNGPKAALRWPPGISVLLADDSRVNLKLLQLFCAQVRTVRACRLLFLTHVRPLQS